MAVIAYSSMAEMLQQSSLTIGEIIFLDTPKINASYLVITKNATPQDGGLVLSGAFYDFQKFEDIVYLNPMWFGAIGNGIANDTDAFNAMFSCMIQNKIGEVIIPSATYYLAGSLSALDSLYTINHVIRGYGAILRTDQAITLFYRRPANTTQQGQYVGHRIDIYGITFEGGSTSGSCAIDIACTYGMVVQDCYFNRLDIGIHVTFGLKCTVRNCFGTNNLNETFYVRSGSGLWTGASPAGSASNAVTISDCRVYSTGAGKTSNFRILESDSLMILRCIGEGGTNAPIYEIKADRGLNTSATNFYVDGFHAENIAKNDYIVNSNNFNLTVISGIRCHLDIKRVYHTGNFTVYYQNDSYAAITGPHFRSQPGANWIIENYFISTDVTSPTAWDGAMPAITYLGGGVIRGINTLKYFANKAATELNNTHKFTGNVEVIDNGHFRYGVIALSGASNNINGDTYGRFFKISHTESSTVIIARALASSTTYYMSKRQITVISDSEYPVVIALISSTFFDGTTTLVLRNRGDSVNLVTAGNDVWEIENLNRRIAEISDLHTANAEPYGSIGEQAICNSINYISSINFADISARGGSNKAIAIGTCMKPGSPKRNGFYYKCIQSGITGVATDSSLIYNSKENEEWIDGTVKWKTLTPWKKVILPTADKFFSNIEILNSSTDIVIAEAPEQGAILPVKIILYNVSGSNNYLTNTMLEILSNNELLATIDLGNLPSYGRVYKIPDFDITVGIPIIARAKNGNPTGGTKTFNISVEYDIL